MSAAIADHRLANQPNVSNEDHLDAQRQHHRMLPIVRRECLISHGSRDRSSDINATSAASMAASLPSAPIAMPMVTRPRHGVTAAETYSAQHDSFAGSLNLEIATIFSASAMAGNTWSRSMKSGMVARNFMAIAAS